MPATEVTLIEETAQKTRRWLDELADELGRPHDHSYALRVLRAFLHTLRDRLPVIETAHLSAQLPELLRGIYYEGWRPATVPHRYHDLDTFLTRMAEEALLAGETEASYAAESAARVMRRHLDPHELHKIAAILPASIASLVEPAAEGAPS